MDQPPDLPAAATLWGGLLPNISGMSEVLKRAAEKEVTKQDHAEAMRIRGYWNSSHGRAEGKLLKYKRAFNPS